MPSVKVEMRGMKELEASLGRLSPLFKAEVRAMMDITVDYFEQLVVKYTPVGATAALRGSISHVITGDPATVLEGRNVHGMLYGDVVEVGRKPGKMPPASALELWVTRKLGISGDEATSVAWLIARKIGKRGTKGARMFEKAFKEGSRRMILYWQDLPRYVLEKAGLNK
jgi:hypothetical protein